MPAEPTGPANETPEDAATARPALTDPDGGLVRALAAAQGAFPTIQKTKTAKVKMKEGGEYTYAYADLADVLGVVRPVLAANGLAITQRTVRGDRGMMLYTELRHVAGGVLGTEVELAQSPSSPQAFGGALTYLRRYELVTLLGIQADEDRDGQDVEQPAAPAPRVELPGWARDATRARVKELGDALEPFIGIDAARELVTAIKGNLDVVPDVLVTFAKALRNRTAAATGEPPAADEPSPAPDDEADAAIAAAEEPPPPDDAPAEDDLGPPAGSVQIEGELPQNPAKAIGTLRAAGCTCEDPLGPSDQADAACPISGHGIPF